MYLVAEGGTHNGCEILPIGLDAAMQIYFRAWRTYFTRTVTFNEAYVGLMQACNDLYDPATCAELEKALQAVELNQPGLCSGIPAVPPACATGTAVDEEIPTLGVLIESIQPNPFNPSTEITFFAKRGQPTRVTVHDVRGQEIEVVFDQESLASGGSAQRGLLRASREWCRRGDREGGIAQVTPPCILPWVPLWVPFVPPLLLDSLGVLWTKFWLNLLLFNRLNSSESVLNTLTDAQERPFGASLNQ